MKILAFSINPIYPQHITGGASKHLVNIVRYLGEAGHSITLLCAGSEALDSSFSLGEGVVVRPILPFHLPFPQPYAISPGELALIAEIVGSELQEHDRFYIHDGELLLPFLQTQVPTIISVRDNYYPESILGTFINQPDAVITVSPYSDAVVRASAGRVLEGLDERMHLVPNGLDPMVFNPADTMEIRLELAIPTDAGPILLYPHRPELSKGLWRSLELLRRLVQEEGLSKALLLMPMWLGEMESEEDRSNRKMIESWLEAHGLTGNVLMHRWLRQDQMAGYYSLGDLTLALGYMPEAFGNVAYESLVCGTPSLVAKVGTHRTQLPDKLIDKVDYGNDAQAQKAAVEMLRAKKRISQEEIGAILEIFAYDRQLKAFERIITQTVKKPVLQARRKKGEVKTFVLPPWCYVSGGNIFHDYHAKYYGEGELPGLLQVSEALESQQFVEETSCNKLLLAELYRLGLIIPE